MMIISATILNNQRINEKICHIKEKLHQRLLNEVSTILTFNHFLSDIHVALKYSLNTTILSAFQSISIRQNSKPKTKMITSFRKISRLPFSSVHDMQKTLNTTMRLINRFHSFVQILYIYSIMLDLSHALAVTKRIRFNVRCTENYA